MIFKINYNMYLMLPAIIMNKKSLSSVNEFDYNQIYFLNKKGASHHFVNMKG